MKLQDRDLNRLTPAYKKMALKIQDDFEAMTNAVISDNRQSLLFYIENNAHTQLKVSDDELSGLGDSIYDDLGSIAHEFFHIVAKKSEKSPDFMEWIAPYALFDLNWYLFDGVYFAKTKNYCVALDYAKRIYEYMPNSQHIAIYGILNDNNAFFEEVFESHVKKHPETSNFRVLRSVTGGTTQESVNFESWQTYYFYYFNKEVSNVMHSHLHEPKTLEKKDATNLVFDELFKHYNENAQINSFLIDDYGDLTRIEDPDFIALNIALSLKVSSLLRPSSGGRNGLRPRPRLKSEDVEKNIQEKVNSILSKYPALTCLEKFQELGVEEKYYRSLIRSIKLENLLDTKENISKPMKI